MEKELKNIKFVILVHTFLIPVKSVFLADQN